MQGMYKAGPQLPSHLPSCPEGLGNSAQGWGCRAGCTASSLAASRAPTLRSLLQLLPPRAGSSPAGVAGLMRTAPCGHTPQLPAPPWRCPAARARSQPAPELSPTSTSGKHRTEMRLMARHLVAAVSAHVDTVSCSCCISGGQPCRFTWLHAGALSSMLHDCPPAA